MINHGVNDPGLTKEGSWPFDWGVWTKPWVPSIHFNGLSPMLRLAKAVEELLLPTVYG